MEVEALKDLPFRLSKVAAPLSSIRTMPFPRWLMQSLVIRALKKGVCSIFKIYYMPTLCNLPLSSPTTVYYLGVGGGGGGNCEHSAPRMLSGIPNILPDAAT
jgi:hypothetical protein